MIEENNVLLTADNIGDALEFVSVRSRDGVP